MAWVVLGRNNQNRTAYPPSFASRFDTKGAADKAAEFYECTDGVETEVIEDRKSE